MPGSLTCTHINIPLSSTSRQQSRRITRISSTFSAVFKSLHSITSRGFCCPACWFCFACLGWTWLLMLMLRNSEIDWISSLELAFFSAPVRNVGKRYWSLVYMRWYIYIKAFYWYCKSTLNSISQPTACWSRPFTNNRCLRPNFREFLYQEWHLTSALGL